MKTKANNEVTLAFPSRSSNEGFARAAVSCFAAQMDPTLNELEDIKTAVSEAVTNCIVHAYPNELGKNRMKLRLYERAYPRSAQLGRIGWGMIHVDHLVR